MDVGGIDNGDTNKEWDNNNEGYYDDEGNWWEWTTEVNEVGKGKGKGVTPQCYRCGGWGHLAKDCATRGNFKGKGGAKGDNKGGKGYQAGAKGYQKGGGYQG